MPAHLPLMIVLFTYILTGLILSYYVWLLWWVMSLDKKCECSRESILGKWYAYTLGILTFFAILIGFMNLFIDLHLSFKIVSIMMFLCIIVVAKLLLNETKKRDCECKYNYNGIVDTVLYTTTFMVLCIIGFFIFWKMSGRSKI